MTTKEREAFEAMREVVAAVAPVINIDPDTRNSQAWRGMADAARAALALADVVGKDGDR